MTRETPNCTCGHSVLAHMPDTKVTAPCGKCGCPDYSSSDQMSGTLRERAQEIVYHWIGPITDADLGKLDMMTDKLISLVREETLDEVEEGIPTGMSVVGGRSGMRPAGITAFNLCVDAMRKHINSLRTKKDV